MAMNAAAPVPICERRISRIDYRVKIQGPYLCINEENIGVLCEVSLANANWKLEVQ